MNKWSVAQRQLMRRSTRGETKSSTAMGVDTAGTAFQAGGSGEMPIDAVLWRIAIPSNQRRPRWILVDEAMAMASSSMPAAHGRACAQRAGEDGEWTRGCVRTIVGDSPKNATRRRATTPRISKSENSTAATLSTSRASSAGVRKSRSYLPPSGSSSSNNEGPGVFISVHV